MKASHTQRKGTEVKVSEPLVMTLPALVLTLRCKTKRFCNLRLLEGLGSRTLHGNLLCMEDRFLLNINNRLQLALKPIMM